MARRYRSIAARVGEVRHVVCASAAYIATFGRPAMPEELAQHQCVTFTALAAPHAWVFRIDGTLRTVSVRSRLTVNTADAAIEAALAGVGLARLISYQVAALLSAGQLVLALEELEPEPVPVHLVYTGAPPMAQKLRAFLDFATPRLRARLAAF